MLNDHRNKTLSKADIRVSPLSHPLTSPTPKASYRSPFPPSNQ